MVVKIKLRHIAAVICLIVCSAALFLWKTPPSSRPSAAPVGSARLPIFLYHILSPSRSYKFGITPDEFESDLLYLSKNGYTTITITQLIACVDSGQALPEKPVILSFDDGYYNNYVYAFPLLKKYHAKMVLSIIGKSTDDFSAVPSDNLSYAHVTWTQLNEMVSSGLVEVQNHTYSLHEMSGGRTGCMQKPGESSAQYEKVLTNDVGKLQREIVQQTGFTPNTFVYPYGKSSKGTDGILRKLGFRATLSCRYGINPIPKGPDDLFGLYRIERTHKQSAESVLNG